MIFLIIYERYVKKHTAGVKYDKIQTYYNTRKGECMKYIAVIFSIFGIELGLKEYIERNKIEGVSEKKLGGTLLLRKHHNKGAFLNAGQNKRKVVAALSVCLTAVATVMFITTFSLAGKELLKWGLALLLGGAYSNTYDRLVRKYVVDYVSFNVPFKSIRRVIFNIGDFCIMIGAMLSVLGYYGK